MRSALLLVLTAAAGWTDAISYVGLGRVFTANMTGNLVLLGLAVGNVESSGAERSAVALAGFVAGALLGSALTRGDATGPWPGRVTAAFGLEAAALALFAALWVAGARLDALIGLSAVGMGLQSAAVRRLAVSGVATTFVTGTLTTLTAGLAALRLAPGWALQAAVLAALLAGAVFGAAAWSRWPALAAAGPAVLLTAVTAVAAVAMRRAADPVRP